MRKKEREGKTKRHRQKKRERETGTERENYICAISNPVRCASRTMLISTRISNIIENHLSITLSSAITAKHGERAENFDPKSIPGNQYHTLIRKANEFQQR